MDSLIIGQYQHQRENAKRLLQELIGDLAKYMARSDAKPAIAEMKKRQMQTLAAFIDSIDDMIQALEAHAAEREQMAWQRGYEKAQAEHDKAPQSFNRFDRSDWELIRIEQETKARATWPELY